MFLFKKIALEEIVLQNLEKNLDKLLYQIFIKLIVTQ